MSADERNAADAARVLANLARTTGADGVRLPGGEVVPIWDAGPRGGRVVDLPPEELEAFSRRAQLRNRVHGAGGSS